MSKAVAAVLTALWAGQGSAATPDMSFGLGCCTKKKKAAVTASSNLYHLANLISYFFHSDDG